MCFYHTALTGFLCWTLTLYLHVTDLGVIDKIYNSVRHFFAYYYYYLIDTQCTRNVQGDNVFLFNYRTIGQIPKVMQGSFTYQRCGYFNKYIISKLSIQMNSLNFKERRGAKCEISSIPLQTMPKNKIH